MDVWVAFPKLCKGSAKSPFHLNSRAFLFSGMSAKVINLAERREKKQKEDLQKPMQGWIVWLQCPTCGTREYSELRMPEGRIHKCGTLVEECEVEIDIRAEYTISMRNSTRLLELLEKSASPGLLKRFLKSGTELLEHLESSEQEYRNRLEMITEKEIPPYPQDWDPGENGVDLKKLEPLGLMLTAARQPELHFPDAS